MASSSALFLIILTFGIVATTVACLPLLLGLKFVSIFITDSSVQDIDSSVVSDSVETESSFTERMICSLLGGVSTRDEKRTCSRVWELK